MKVLIVGSEGAQGRRYQCILKFLGHEVYRVDLKLTGWAVPPTEIDRIIIATPTDSHIGLMRYFLSFRKPMLIEKPVTKSLTELYEITRLAKDANVPLSMVCQYRQLYFDKEPVPSYYDYFRHGNDGLIWDCLQIIGHAQGQVTLAETSPVWRCGINGMELEIACMDDAYVAEVKAWLDGNPQPWQEAITMHEKTRDYERKHS